MSAKGFNGDVIRPYRKDGYRSRTRVHVRIDDGVISRIDGLAESLELSRAHLCDLVLGIAVEEGGEWLRQAINRRVEKALALRRSKWEG